MDCLRSIRKLARNQSHSLVMHKGLGFRHLQLLDLLTEAFHISRSIFINNGLPTNDTSQTQKSTLRGKTLWLLLALRFINFQPSHEPPLEGRSHPYIVFDFLRTLSKLECAQCLQCTAAMQGKFDYSFHLSTIHHPGMFPDCKWWLGQNPKADVPKCGDSGTAALWKKTNDGSIPAWGANVGNHRCLRISTKWILCTQPVHYPVKNHSLRLQLIIKSMPSWQLKGVSLCFFHDCCLFSSKRWRYKGIQQA